LDCDHAWTTSAKALPKRPETKAPRVAASARDMVAALRKIPPPSADQIRLMLAKTRKRTQAKKRQP
jgi:hypothetical protein